MSIRLVSSKGGPDFSAAEKSWTDLRLVVQHGRLERRAHRVMLAASCDLLAEKDYGNYWGDEDDLVLAPDYSAEAAQAALDYVYGRRETVSEETADLLTQLGCTWGRMGGAKVKVEVDVDVPTEEDHPVAINMGKDSQDLDEDQGYADYFVGHDMDEEDEDMYDEEEQERGTGKKKRRGSRRNVKAMDEEEDEDYDPYKEDSDDEMEHLDEDFNDVNLDEDGDQSAKGKRGRPGTPGKGNWYEWPEFKRLDKLGNANSPASPDSQQPDEAAPLVKCPLPGCKASVGPRADHAAAHVAEAHGEARACTECGMVAPNKEAADNHWRRSDHEKGKEASKSGPRGHTSSTCKWCGARFDDVTQNMRHRIECHVSSLVNFPKSMLEHDHHHDHGEGGGECKDHHVKNEGNEAFKCSQGDFEGEKVSFRSTLLSCCRSHTCTHSFFFCSCTRSCIISAPCIKSGFAKSAGTSTPAWRSWIDT